MNAGYRMNSVAMFKLLFIGSFGQRVLVAALLGLSLNACDSVDTGNVVVAGAAGTQVWELTPPTTILPRAVDQNQLFPRVTLNGVNLNMTQQNNGVIWQGVAQVPEGEPAALRVDWIEFFRSRELLLAVSEQTYPAITRDTAVILFDRDYVVDDLDTYPLLDDDNDRVPNLTEREENSDPLLSTDPGLTRANAFIAPIDPSRAPVIDGSYDLVWGEAQYRDRDEELLTIDNRLIGFDPDRPDGNTEFRWGGLHDGQFLYLFVLGESGDNRSSQGDSAQPWHDDAIDIFWDGNRSQGTSYDGVDDYHIIIPLLKLNENARNRSNLDDGSVDPSGRALVGFNSQVIPNLDGVTFATCVCPSGDTYEVRLDLQKLGIPLGRSFGFDVQINNDIDGDTREFKFGWQAPSADATEFSADRTWEDPSTMGLLELVPAN